MKLRSDACVNNRMQAGIAGHWETHCMFKALFMPTLAISLLPKGWLPILDI